MNNLLIFDYEQRKDQLFSIHDPKRVGHLNQVLRAKQGDEIRICYVDKGLGTGIIHKLNDREAIIKLLELAAGFAPWCHLIMGLSRPPTCKKVLEHGTSMGIGEFQFFRAGMSEKSYLSSKLFQNYRFLEPIYAGLAQSGRYFQTPGFKLNNSVCFESIEHLQHRYILSPSAEDSFTDHNIDFDQKLVLAIGPERGWNSSEVHQFQEAGFKQVKIARSLLRVEIALFAALGALETLRFSRNLNRTSNRQVCNWHREAEQGSKLRIT